MFDAIAPRYDLVNRIMTLRLDVAWRRRTVRELALPAGSLVADLACGTGDFCRELARLGHHRIGFDFSMGMLRAARAADGTVPLVNSDVLELPLPDSALDGATCGFALRNLTAVPPLFVELARVLRSGGRIGLLEVDSPTNAVLRWGHGLYFGRVVPLIGGVLSDRDAYRYLPESVAYLPPPEELLAGLRSAGFIDVDRHKLSAGIAQLITATRR
ncbi:MAG: ubiquinone/menaquinone biosynthesis methyltransferase [Acidimicrobiaceae bacterium]|nr:ubiquinone/menaquinone biosynthesis methyltransferase [Acidimicrobiaceae bacterium]MYF42875.1 ubiquinone/menaquinone biosynthesis methyltransferase [Acidimicrobiaceae bacterium]